VLKYNGLFKKLVIFGNGSNADIMGHYLEKERKVAAYTVDGACIKESSFRGKPIVPFENLSVRFPHKYYDAFVAIGYQNLNRLRLDVVNKFLNCGYNLVSYIDTEVFYKTNTYTNNSIGYNCFIMELNNLQYNTRVSNNVVLWSGNHIGHETIIRDNVYIASHVVISGHCDIGENTFMGVNSYTSDGIKIGKNNLIGAGAYVAKNTEDETVVVPAKSKNMGFDDLSFEALEMWRH